MLKNRLKQVAVLVEEETLIDIGTDHGYLIIDLLNSHKIKRALAVEIATGPLENVKTNVANYRLQAKVKCLQSDGLKDIPKDITSNYAGVSICGMGGTLIAKIITDSIDKISGKSLYLQANNGEYGLRKVLVENGYTICFETICVDNGIYYEIIKAVPKPSKLSDKELYFGPHNLSQKTANFRSKHTARLNHLIDLNKQLMDKQIENQKIIAEIKILKEVLYETF